ncbi:MAG: hypothetical protein ACTSVU_07245 [Promethearchaeota archaeon]
MKNKSSRTDTMDWPSVVQQIFDMIGADTAIINRYGLILASRIPGMEVGDLFSPKVFNFILDRKEISKELQVNSINSIVMNSEEGNLIISFAKYVYLLSKIPLSVDLNTYIPSIQRILKTLDKSGTSEISIPIKNVKLDDEFELLKNENKDIINQERFPIFKHLIKFIRKKK